MAVPLSLGPVHHLRLTVTDVERSRAFYTELLGFQIAMDAPLPEGDPHHQLTTDILQDGIVMANGDLLIGLRPVAGGRSDDRFDPFRCGLDHLSFSVPGKADLEAAVRTFDERGVEHSEITDLPPFGIAVLPFKDPDGTSLALVGVAGAESEPAFGDGGIAPEHAIRGFAGVTLMLEDAAPTGAILTDVLGFSETGREGPLVRFAADGTALGGSVDIRVAPGFLPGRMGGGSVHHIAFRAADDAVQAAMVQRLADHHKIRTTEQLDRNYFRSVYFREPGGVLFEIATDDPGFAADEPVAQLGQGLKLPRFLEPRRKDIEAVLPELG
jgi:catechol 2,3-dioxygenase-like lactoylglutathione lyase family enzyme